jgi:hypothetical protein
MLQASRLPTFVIIGAMKAGTTSLHRYLDAHPQIFMARPKELDFFVEGRNWERGVDWYREHFDPVVPVRGESSPNYTADPYLPGVAERMAGVVPDAKLIFMVRDPVERVRANWIHTYSNRVEDRPLREAVLDPNAEYLARSRYHHQLSRFLEHYPMERILVLEQEELLEERRETLVRVWRFLEVRDTVWREAFNIKRLESGERRRKTRLGRYVSGRVPHSTWRRLRSHRPFSTPFVQSEMDDELRAELADRLRDDAERFRALVGRPFESWSV